MKTRLIYYSSFLIVSVIFYFISINYRSFWGDEILSIHFASTTIKDTIKTCIYDCHPPLYFILLNIWIKLTGDSERALRLFQALQIFSLNLLTFKLNNISKNKADSKILLFFLAFSPFSLLFSPMLRYYSLTAILALSATILFESWLNDKRKTPLLIIFYTFILYTDYPTASIILAHFIYLCIKNRSCIKSYITTLFVTTILFLPWFLPFIKQLMHVANPQHSADLSSKIILQFILRICWTLWSFMIGETILPFQNLGIICIIFISLLFGFFLSKRKKKNLDILWLYIIITAIIFTITITTVLVKHSSFIYIGARSFFIFPFFILLLARLITVRSSLFKKITISIFFILFTIANINLINRKSFAMPVYAIPWKTIITEIPENNVLIAEESIITNYYKSELNRTELLIFPPSRWEEAIKASEIRDRSFFTLTLGRDSTKTEIPENFEIFLKKQKKRYETRLLKIPDRYLIVKEKILKAKPYKYKVIVAEYKLQ